MQQKMTQEQILRRIPCNSNGKPRNDRMAEIKRLLSSFRFEPEELAIFEKEVEYEIRVYGYHGRFQPKTRARKREPKPNPQLQMFSL